jgi:hypothetical protein
MKLTASLLAFAAALATTSCLRNSKPDLIDIKTAIQNREVLNGKRVAIKGFMVMDMLDVPNFMVELGEPSNERITESIDVIPENERVKTAMANLDGKCIVIIGKFNQYGPREIRTGNLVSKYADVLVNRVLGCVD